MVKFICDKIVEMNKRKAIKTKDKNEKLLETEL